MRRDKRRKKVKFRRSASSAISFDFLFAKEDTMFSAHSRKILVLLATLAFAAVNAFPAHARAFTITEKVTEPFESFEIACNGEEVFLSGELHLTFHTTIDNRGGIHEKFTLVPSQVRGVGSEGTLYKAVGGARSHFNADADFAPLNITDTSMFNLVSQGGSDNLQVKFTFHVTVNANGVETVVVENFSAECVG